jgi:hypothetical protein
VRNAVAIAAFCFAILCILGALLNLATDPNREPLFDFAIRNLTVPAAGLVLSALIVAVASRPTIKRSR